MNCKPGDLAKVVCPAHRFHGMLVEVLYAAPAQDFALPDGYGHIGVEPGLWVVHILDREARAELENGLMRVARYGVIGDFYLRPISGDELPEDVEHKEEQPA